MASRLRTLGWSVVPGCANFLLAELPGSALNAHEFVDRCQRRGLYLRDAARMGTQLGQRMVRIAVKDPNTTTRMIEMMSDAQSSNG